MQVDQLHGNIDMPVGFRKSYFPETLTPIEAFEIATPGLSHCREYNSLAVPMPTRYQAGMLIAATPGLLSMLHDACRAQRTPGMYR